MKNKIFVAVAFCTLMHLNARHYETLFSEWGRSLDDMYSSFNTLHTRSQGSFSPAFTLEKNDDQVLVSLDTGKKVTADDIVITHKNNRVLVKVKGLDHTLNVTLESSRSSFGISMCTQENSEKKDEHSYRVYEGSSCMQQVMSVAVDLARITAEYSGTKLILSVPLMQEPQGKKIEVVMKDRDSAAKKQEPIQKNKKRVDEK